MPDPQCIYVYIFATAKSIPSCLIVNDKFIFYLYAFRKEDYIRLLLPLTFTVGN